MNNKKKVKLITIDNNVDKEKKNLAFIKVESERKK